MTIAIHQPNFFPWFPFFQKLKGADLFVMMSNCQYEKGGYQNRFYMDGAWHTMSTEKGMVSIREKNYLTPHTDWKKIKMSLPTHYSHVVARFDHCINESLERTNAAIIKQIVKTLGIETLIAPDFPTENKATERLVEICKRYNARTYLSGISGKDYLNLDLFKKEGIEVVFQKEEDMIKEPILETLQRHLTPTHASI